ncbi:MAG: hypothetical protein KAR07_03785, partial [Spirochaetes bacterium]|nr:hypothetical protein [Spirochaetota bacterium]
GNVGDKIAFSPYGQVIYQMNTNSLLEEKFTGQILDEETGLYYYNSRYYDPKIGVFISPDSLIPDPFDSQMLNRYMYVRGNPVMYVDPDGHSAILIGMVIGAVVGTVAGGTHGFTDFSQFDWNAAWKGGVTGAVLGGLTGGSISIAAAPAGTVSSFTSSVVNSAMWGSYFGAATGGISAYRAGGDVFSGMLLGSAVGGLSGAATGALGNWLTPQTKNLLGYIGSGMVKGTVSGAGMGLISGYGGGQGDFQSMLEGLSKGAMFGALFGGAVGAGEYYLKYGGWKEMNLKLGNIKDKLGKSIDNPSLTIYNREKYGITLNSKIVKGANHLSIKIPSSFNVNTKALIKSAIGTAFFHTSIAAAGFSFNDKIIEALKKRIEDGVEGKIRY